MLLVTEGKRKVNQLGYSKRTHEYVYFHNGIEVWREKGNEDLLNYFEEVRAGEHLLKDSDIKDNPIWKKYGESCQKFELEELKGVRLCR